MVKMLSANLPVGKAIQQLAKAAKIMRSGHVDVGGLIVVTVITITFLNVLIGSGVIRRRVYQRPPPYLTEDRQT